MRHLVKDAEVAEELSYRYADSRGKFAPEWRQRLASCMDTLSTTIARTHGVPLTQVMRARELLNEPRFDVVKVLPLIVIFAVIGWLSAGWIARRFGDADRVPWFAACAIVSLVMTSVVLVLGSIAASLVQDMQRRDMHASYRGQRPTWIGTHAIALALVASALIWYLAYLRAQKRAMTDAEHLDGLRLR